MIKSTNSQDGANYMGDNKDCTVINGQINQPQTPVKPQPPKKALSPYLCFS